MNENQKWTKAALNWLLNNKTITEEQYKEFIKYYENQKDFNKTKQELTRMNENDINFINEKYKEVTKKK